MVNYRASQYFAAQHRDDLLREAERDRVARAVMDHDDTSRALAVRDVPQTPLLARIQSAVRGRSAAPAAAPAVGASIPPAIQR